ncbi:PilZ domain-containing protein [Limisalsivibrio acetivorans]|uniref:PilZ domain-containing protein n=1 Tax=Limisalsivibrio acetivorans TaxID=1304888 RepID=UPI0003B72B7E|nr:PilZ domain-containing protein [Limisalsivibrio acetivorans]
MTYSDNSVAVANRRNAVRSSLAMKICIFHFEDTEKGRAYSKCFMSRTVDMSETGAQILQKGHLKEGDVVELRVKHALTLKRCLDCDKLYKMKNTMEIAPLTATVMWAKEDRCGLRFDDITKADQNTISKYVWQKHLKEIKKFREE